jgi:hypothetical protein
MKMELEYLVGRQVEVIEEDRLKLTGDFQIISSLPDEDFLEGGLPDGQTLCAVIMSSDQVQLVLGTLDPTQKVLLHEYRIVLIPGHYKIWDVHRNEVSDPTVKETPFRPTYPEERSRHYDDVLHTGEDGDDGSQGKES